MTREPCPGGWWLARRNSVEIIVSTWIDPNGKEVYDPIEGK